VSTSAVDTWRDVKIRTKNLREVPNRFLPLIQVPLMIQNKTEVLNSKSCKTQVPIGYLTLFLNVGSYITQFREYISSSSSSSSSSFFFEPTGG
jgi:hypothetical protein